MLKNERFGKATFTRRDALKIAGAAGVMAALPWSGIPEAEAAAPALKGPQAGGYYRFSVGEIEAMVVSDGSLSFQPIQPTQVTGVVLTHAHGDHFGGLLDVAGKPVFPNAAYFASKTEAELGRHGPPLPDVRPPRVDPRLRLGS